MNAKPAHILVAEDDKSVRLVVQQALARQGYTVQSSGTAAGLWKLIEAGRGDVLISDIGLPDGDALDLLPRIQQKRPDMPVIVMSARSTLLTAVKAQQTGVFEYLPKPFELRSLVEATSRAVGSIGQSLAANAGYLQGHGACRRHRPDGSDHRRERNRQGAGGAGASRSGITTGWTFRAHQHGGNPAKSGRVRAFWT